VRCDPSVSTAALQIRPGTGGGRPPAPRARPGEGLTTLSPATPTSVRSAGQGKDAAVWQGAVAQVLGMNKVFLSPATFSQASLATCCELATGSLGCASRYNDISMVVWYGNDVM
jgi:hypothetical protein